MLAQHFLTTSRGWWIGPQCRDEVLGRSNSSTTVVLAIGAAQRREELYYGAGHEMQSGSYPHVTLPGVWIGVIEHCVLHYISNSTLEILVGHDSFRIVCNF